MTTINLLPETLKSQHHQKILGQRAFLTSFALLILFLVTAFTLISYEQILKKELLSLENSKQTEESIIQSLKDTEGVYRSLTAKTKVLAYALDQKKDPGALFTQVKTLGTLSNVEISGFSFSSESLEVLGNAPDYETLSKFIEQMMSLNESIKLIEPTLKNVTLDEEKGRIEFAVEANFQ